MNRPNIAGKSHPLALPNDLPSLAAAKHRDTFWLKQSFEGQESGLGPAWPEHVTRDDVPLDFAGSLPNALHPGIAPNTLQRKVGH